MECDASKWGWCCTACIWRHTTPSRAGTKLGRDAPPLRRQTRRVDAGRAVRRAVLVDPRANDSQKRLDSRSPTKPRVQLALMGHQRVLASARSGVPDGAVPDHHAAHGGSDEHRREWIARVRDRRGGWGRQEGATQQVGDNRRRDGRSSPSWAERRARRGSYCTPHRACVTQWERAHRSQPVFPAPPSADAIRPSIVPHKGKQRPGSVDRHINSSGGNTASAAATAD